MNIFAATARAFDIWRKRRALAKQMELIGWLEKTGVWGREEWVRARAKAAEMEIELRKVIEK